MDDHREVLEVVFQTQLLTVVILQQAESRRCACRGGDSSPTLSQLASFSAVNCCSAGSGYQGRAVWILKWLTVVCSSED